MCQSCRCNSITRPSCLIYFRGLDRYQFNQCLTVNISAKYGCLQSNRVNDISDEQCVGVTGSTYKSLFSWLIICYQLQIRTAGEHIPLVVNFDTIDARFEPSNTFLIHVMVQIRYRFTAQSSAVCLNQISLLRLGAFISKLVFHVHVKPFSYHFKTN